MLNIANEERKQIPSNPAVKKLLRNKDKQGA